MGRWPVVTAAVLLSALIFGAQAPGQVDLPRPRDYVEDYANVINGADEQSLNHILGELEQKTGAKYIVLTVETTGGVPIQRFSVEVFERWQPGQKDKDNGMLFVLASQDRKYWFTPGYGLEGFLTDQYCGQVGRKILEPQLKKGNYSRGIYEANAAVAQRIARQAGVTLSGGQEVKSVPAERRRTGLPCCSFLPFLFILFLIFGGLGRGMGWWLFLPFMFGGFGSFGGYGRSGSYGGGSFGGGFGGFGGGWGGGCSGGGAGGSW